MRILSHASFNEHYPSTRRFFNGTRTLIHDSRYEDTGSVENQPRPDGPSKLTSRAKRMIVRSATNIPMTSAQNIANELLSSYNVSTSAQTVRNGLHSAGLKARTPRKKPYIRDVVRECHEFK
ncbi:hypothetical protein TNCV_3409821 [Trichonephila clavipes]|nr:hypothetical protein TNCV_3409821 [Trichonephila clavipes]